MAKIYTADQATARALQAKLREARGYPCCQCHVKPDADCPCTDHRDGTGRILPGPHSPLTVATEAVDVRENPKLKGEFFAAVPTAYEKHLRAADRAPLTEKTLADVTADLVFAEEEEIDGKIQ